jgi:hypothetical protein
MKKLAHYKGSFIVLGIAIFVVGLFILQKEIDTHAASMPPVAIDPNTLAGIETTNEPWQTELSNLLSRLHAIGLRPLPQEGTALHIHQHLDLYVHGKQVVVPASIGINEAAGYISPIHTHDTTGVIHIESPTVRDFTLGEFFDVWGLRFTQQSIGGYTSDATNTLAVYVNGQPYAGDPRALVLGVHQEIVVEFGTDKELPNPVPSTYVFGAGL